jgi:glutamate-ammonia-ligase adenylyltransferase
MSAFQPRDLLLAPRLLPDQAATALAPYGFQDPRRADEHLQAMAQDPLTRGALADVVDEVLYCAARSPDPDQALLQLERVSALLNRRQLFAHFRETPAALSRLLPVLGASEHMADILVRDPGHVYWITDPAVIGRALPPRRLRQEVASALASYRTDEKRRDLLRLVKRHELLHIGARDILRLASVEETLGALSQLAEVLIDAACALAGAGDAFAVLGLGKLGGGELNFSSDVDLLYVHADRTKGPAPDFAAVGRAVTAALADTTAEGHVYRVDLRLRPEGRVGSLVQSPSGLRAYYEARGRTWERLALVKAWPAGGSLRVARRALAAVRPFLYDAPFGPDEQAAVWQLKAQIDQTVARRGETRRNVKLGIGGIREIELVTQSLQLRFGGRRTVLRQRGTLAALFALREARLLPAAEHDTLAKAYVFLRDVENKLQMAAGAQEHALPNGPAARRRLARTLGYADDDTHDAVRDFESDHRRHTEAVRAIFEETFRERSAAGPDPGYGTPPPED